MPTFDPTESSAVSYVRYDERTRRLYLAYRDSRDMYAYLDVPPELYQALLAANSKGRFINEHVKERYDFRRLRKTSWTSARKPSSPTQTLATRR